MMFKTRHITIALLGAITLFFSCKKEEKTTGTPTTDTIYAKVAGTWKHIENHGTFDNLPGDPPHHSDFRYELDGSDRLILRSNKTFTSTVNIIDGYINDGPYEIDSAKKITMYESSRRIGSSDTLGHSIATFYFYFKSDTLVLYNSWQQANFLTYQAAVLVRE